MVFSGDSTTFHILILRIPNKPTFHSLLPRAYTGCNWNCFDYPGYDRLVNPSTDVAVVRRLSEWHVLEVGADVQRAPLQLDVVGFMIAH